MLPSVSGDLFSLLPWKLIVWFLQTFHCQVRLLPRHPLHRTVPPLSEIPWKLSMIRKWAALVLNGAGSSSPRSSHLKGNQILFILKKKKSTLDKVFLYRQRCSTKAKTVIGAIDKTTVASNVGWVRKVCHETTAPFNKPQPNYIITSLVVLGLKSDKPASQK